MAPIIVCFQELKAETATAVALRGRVELEQEAGVDPYIPSGLGFRDLGI